METFGEYDPATPLAQSYCSRITAQEYEVQGSMETYDALQGLLEYLDSNSDVFKKVLAKKKQEEAENEGIFSFLKCKLFEKLKGPDFMLEGIGQEECEEGLQQMQSEMCQVFNYAQDTKSSPVAKRFSKRLAAKRVKRGSPQRSKTPKRTRGTPAPPPYPPPGSAPTQADDGSNILRMVPSPRKPLRHGVDSGKESKNPEGVTCSTARGPPSAPAPPPPPPLPQDASRGISRGPPSAPPPPPPPYLPGSTRTPSSAAKKPLGERTNTIINTPTGKPSPAKKPLLKCDDRLNQLKKVGSTTSLNSIHDELMGFNKAKLKSVKTSSPGQTPKRKVPSRGSGGRATSGAIGVDSFNLKILEKFRNVHSPSPSRYGSPGSGCNSFDSTSGFTP